MKHEKFVSWCLNQPWALIPEVMAGYAIALARNVSDSAEPPLAAQKATRGQGNSGRVGAIAVIPIYGTIVQRAQQLGICEGGTSTQQISGALAAANADDGVSQILLEIDSPGGGVYGLQELVSEIAASRKPVVAIANSLALAYWIGSAASEFYVTPGAKLDQSACTWRTRTFPRRSKRKAST